MIIAGPAHAGVLAALHGTVFPDEPWDGEAFTGLLGQPGMTGMIDERGGFLLLRVVADEAEIITVGVVLRRRGLGRALLAAALSTARDQGAKAVFLEVAAANEAARGLYQAAGFQPCGIRHKYYISGDDALIMRLSLCE